MLSRLSAAVNADHVRPPAPHAGQAAATREAARTRQAPDSTGPAVDVGGRRVPVVDLQRLAGNRAVGEILRSARRPDGVRGRVVARQLGSLARPVQRKPSAADVGRRTRATKLGAADARTLLGAKLPVALATMTDAQIGQMQRVLDGYVTNPEIQKEAAALDKKSVIAESGGYQNVDERVARQASSKRDELVSVSEADRRIRLDHKLLLTKDALSPRSDNPDEVRYLTRVSNTLANRGIYLRFNPKRVRDLEDPSVWTIDPRQFEAWLSLGPTGDAIPTQDGKVDREALLKTQLLGAGYYEHVDIGPAQSALRREINRLVSNIDSGIDQHSMLERIRDGAFPGVAQVVDLVGGADFPDTRYFDAAHKLVVRALEMNIGGNLAGSQAFLVCASVLARDGALQLKSYLDATNSGGEMVVKVLKVAKVAGQVAAAGLAVTGVVALAEGGIAAATGEGAAAFSSDLDVAAQQTLDRYAARQGLHADELRVIQTMKSPPGSVAGGVKPGTSSGAGEGFHKMF